MAQKSFPKTTRLLNSQDFSTVFKEAKRHKYANFWAYTRPTGQNSARLGIAVSKKNVAAAVERNRLRRLVRESFRLNRETLAGIDVVIIAQKPAMRQTNPNLFEELSQLWTKLVGHSNNFQ